ncbi:hypothetical protein N657DRAFT_368656 [Parathielavia appendiculata]|uniref:Ubiquitin-like domain-containing protein n=1 Tax=Parathielavia appendiculata TaxID=2587402 RepID=A0AAN6YYB6_9PEZI|nr:hypothetical protein N657DRAFT_368656 [Parathielavia appendiculata]
MNQFELCVQGPSEEAVNLKLSPSHTVTQLRSLLAIQFGVAAEQLFLVADNNLSKKLEMYEPDFVHTLPVAQLVEHGSTVCVKIGSALAALGPFIVANAATREPAHVMVDKYIIITDFKPPSLARNKALNGGEMISREVVVHREGISIDAEISETVADGPNSRMVNSIMLPAQHDKAQKIDLFMDLLKRGLSIEEAGKAIQFLG